ncbi:MAG: phosphatase PAP2 family protein [Bacteroidales bacterium]|jgi:membrane-associated phospholipid phosphatase|nr:phosphatase PAP2 family protein [Bacteroidales bacterium]
MDEVKLENSLDKTAKTASAVLHPIFIPLYGLMLVFSLPTLYGYIPFPVKKLLVIMILVNNIALPLFMLLFLKAKRHIMSWEMESRRERMLPLFFVTLLYAITSYIVIKYPTPIFIKTYFIGVFFISASITIINNWWKISIHAAGMGALTALALILSLRMYSVTALPLMAVVTLSGVVLFSRLRLNYHTPAQVWCGFLLGFAGLDVICRLL